MYYYGMKLHALAFRREGSIPFPEQLILSMAKENNLAVFKQQWGECINNRRIFADKAYFDDDYFSKMEKNQNAIMATPVKTVKGEQQVIRQIDKAVDDLFSTAVSIIR